MCLDAERQRVFVFIVISRRRAIDNTSMSRIVNEISRSEDIKLVGQSEHHSSGLVREKYCFLLSLVLLLPVERNRIKSSLSLLEASHSFLPFLVLAYLPRDDETTSVRDIPRSCPQQFEFMSGIALHLLQQMRYNLNPRST